MTKAQLLNNLGHSAILLLLGSFQFEACCKGERLRNRKRRKQDIILHHIRRILLERLLVHWDGVIEKDVAAEAYIAGHANAIRQNVEQRSFSGPRATHNEGGLAWSRKPRHRLHNLFGLLQAEARISLPLLLRCIDCHLKFYVLPAELDRLFAQFFCIFDQLDRVDVYTRRQRHSPLSHTAPNQTICWFGLILRRLVLPVKGKLTRIQTHSLLKLDLLICVHQELLVTAVLRILYHCFLFGKCSFYFRKIYLSICLCLL